INKTLRNWKWFFRSNMHWGYDLPELLITEMMQRDGMLRVDTYGRTDRDACYTLHPVLKPKAFIESLPELLRRIDSNDIPESQRGYYNVHNDFFDFEGVR
ncbi:MAG: hypothetical protein JST42_08710, partial [Bacteroidetes bacterium]|nr:hypothetical protein [Bacteroidota bacterium]